MDGEVIVEIKSKDSLHPIDEAQLLSHPRLLDIQIGLLINFNVLVLKDGLKRMVNNYQDSPERIRHDFIAADTPKKSNYESLSDLCGRSPRNQR